MLRHLSQPFDAGISHGGVGVEAFGDRMTDDGLTFLPEQRDELLLLLNQRINLRRLVVQEGCDALLLVFGRATDAKCTQYVLTYIWLSTTSS